MKGPPSSEPTRSVQPITEPGDPPPALPPRELPQADRVERWFEAAGKTWVARLSGKGACGTGTYGLGLVDAIHFFEADALERPVREALLAHGRFAGLFDSELAELLAEAAPIILPEEH